MSTINERLWGRGFDPSRMCLHRNIPMSRQSSCACIDLSGRMPRVAKEPFVFFAVVGELLPCVVPSPYRPFNCAVSFADLKRSRAHLRRKARAPQYTLHRPRAESFTPFSCPLRARSRRCACKPLHVKYSVPYRRLWPPVSIRYLDTSFVY